MNRALFRGTMLGLLVVGVIAIGIALGTILFTPDKTPGGGTGVAAIGGPFSLVDQNGQRRTDSDFRGKVMMIYFGYAFCPDACPTALQAMTLAMKQLGDKANEVVPIFVTVDPARDTVELLKTYASNFDPRLVALTGTPEEIARAAKAYRVYYAKVGDPKATEDYTMDHSSVIYLMDRNGRYVTHFTHTATPDKLAAALRDML